MRYTDGRQLTRLWRGSRYVVSLLISVPGLPTGSAGMPEVFRAQRSLSA
ncbi:MAG TPA: hypothetical protein VMB74_09705 [Streptosporangiaceae bacterium]|nr:hypothetical protein [Streptosporangiaceae bacterium]